MKTLFKLRIVSWVCAAGLLAPASVVLADSVEVRPNDTLSGIVLQAYPGALDRRAVMQAILEKNPHAFINNNIDLLIIGKTLDLPEISTIPQNVIQAQPGVSPELLTRLEAVTKERDRLSGELKKLEAENDELKERIGRLEILKEQQDSQLQQLEQQIESLQASASGKPAGVAVVSDDQLQQLERQVTQLKRDTGTLESDKTALQRQLETVQKSNQDLQSENSELKQQLDVLQKAQSSHSDAAEELNKLLASSNDLKASNAELQKQMDEAKQQLVGSQREAETLKQELATLSQHNDELQAELQAANDEAVLLQSDLQAVNDEIVLLQDDLQAANDANVLLQGDVEQVGQQNLALRSDIDQIQAAASSDVALQGKQQSGILGRQWWPWLLALLLLPIAWLLGRRSRPAAALATTSATAAATALHQASQTQVSTDPVIPDPTLHVSTDDQLAAVPQAPDTQDAAIKLDMARAYLDLRDAEAANDVLQDVMREGGTAQQQEAREILSFLK